MIPHKYLGGRLNRCRAWHSNFVAASASEWTENHSLALAATSRTLFRRRFPILLGGLVWTGFSCAVWAQNEPARPLGDLSGAWHLLVDDSLLAEKTGVTRNYHAFEKDRRNPVLAGDRPWEGKVVYVYGSVLPNEDRRGYRMWYHAWDGEYTNLYATSADGITWDKPSLGLVDFKGSRDNNLFFRRTKEDHLPQVIATPGERDPARRYKLINYDYGRTKPNNLISGFYGAYSADGIHWRDVARNPILADPGDVGNFVWDPRAKKYVGYPKIFAPVDGFRRRSVGYTATDNFESWPPSELILMPDKFDDRWVTKDRQHTDFYGLSAFPYESGYIGFLWIFRITEGDNDGPMFVELVSSRDGVTWHRQEGERTPLLPLGPPGSWDAGMVKTVNQPLVEGDRIKLYYGGTNFTHGILKGKVSGVGLATLRKDGFASLDAESSPGVVTTRLFARATGELRVNGDFRRGALKAELLDANGRPVPGYTFDDCAGISSDGINLPVRWRQHATLPRGAAPLAIRFQLTQGSLFSFFAGPAAMPLDAAPPADRVHDFEDTANGHPIELRGAAKIQAAKESDGKALMLAKSGDVADLPGTNRLGTKFTLAARVKTTNAFRTRLMSTHRGSGEPASGELIFDFNPRSGVVRLVVNGQHVQSRPRYLGDRQFHHYAATYDNGDVVLYVDGAPVGAGRIRQGSAHLFSDRSIIEHFGEGRSAVGVHLAADLRIGEDMGGRFITYREEATNSPAEQLNGLVDDIVVARRVLSGAEVAKLGQPRSAIGAVLPPK